MTLGDLERFVERFELVAPVTMDDLAAIHAELVAQVAVGFSIEVVLRGNRVELVIGGGGPAPVRRWLQVSAGDAAG